MSKFLGFLLSIFIPAILAMTCGCSTLRNYYKNQDQKKIDIALKKSNYLALKSDITSNALAKGHLAENIKAKYGPPDDIFYSSSSISSFQIWTYDMTKGRLADADFSPIILYIENDKLINWKY